MKVIKQLEHTKIYEKEQDKKLIFALLHQKKNL
jgi:hypothetical protein